MSCKYYEEDAYYGCKLCSAEYEHYDHLMAFRGCIEKDRNTYNCNNWRDYDHSLRDSQHCPINNFVNSINYDPSKICYRLKLEYNGYSRIIAKCGNSGSEMSYDAIKTLCMCPDLCADYGCYNGNLKKLSPDCYISTACVVAKGLPDDCDELQTLRAFRDKMSKEDEAIAEIVKEYYKNAPVIVEKINQENNSEEIYNFLYNNLVVACVTKVKENKIQDAVDIYTSIYQGLKKKYILDSAH